MIRSLASARAGHLFLWWGGAALALLAFVRITRELIEGEVAARDKAVIEAGDKIRTPWLTGTAVDITALGSVTVVVLLSALALVVLLALRDRLGALQLLAASAGAAILTTVAKNLIDRARPEEAQRLLIVSGFSYPSGHSVSTAALYLTIAILAGRHVPQAGARAAIFPALLARPNLEGSTPAFPRALLATAALSRLFVGARAAALLAAVRPIIT